jgi:apolipoprotein N-acyltransferase
MRLIQGLLGFRPVTSVLERFFPSGEELERFTTACFWSVISAGVLSLAFPKFEISCLAWIGLTPFLRQLYQCGPKQGFWIGLVFGWVFFYLNLLWLNQLYAFNPWIVAGVPLMALIFAFFGPACLARWRRSFCPDGGGCGFSSSRRSGRRSRFCALRRNWASLALSGTHPGQLAPDHPTVRPDRGRRHLLCHRACQSALADSYRFILRKNELGAYRSIGPKWFVAILAVAALSGYGQWRLNLAGGGWKTERFSPPVSGRAPSAAVEQQRKFASYTHEDPSVQVSIQKQMNEELVAQLNVLRDSCKATSEPLPNLYVLPESALTNDYFNLVPAFPEMVHRWSREMGAPIFFGANRVDGTVENGYLQEGARFYNSAYLATPDKGVDVAGAYDKQRLVPFGEYAPFLGKIPGFQQYVLQLGSFSMGDVARIFQVGSKRFGCLICFESCFPYLMRQFESSDPDWMTIITNDGWYGRSSGPRRHQTQAIFRAVETRRPIVRVANTGISCVVDPWGRVVKSLALNEEKPTQVLVDMPERPAEMKGHSTFYMRYGEWFAWLCVALCGVTLLRVFILHRRAVSDDWSGEASVPQKIQPPKSPSKRPGKTR